MPEINVITGNLTVSGVATFSNDAYIPSGYTNLSFFPTVGAGNLTKVYSTVYLKSNGTTTTSPGDPLATGIKGFVYYTSTNPEQISRHIRTQKFTLRTGNSFISSSWQFATGGFLINATGMTVPYIPSGPNEGPRYTQGVTRLLTIDERLERIETSGTFALLPNERIGFGTFQPRDKVHISGGNLRTDGTGFFNSIYLNGVPVGTSSDTVRLTGNQEIDGQKNFLTRPQFDYTDIPTVSEVVDLSNSQEIYGVKNFIDRPQYNYSDIATLGEVVDINNNQEVYGQKNFLNRPQYNYSDIPTVNEVVDLSNNQEIYGQKNFINRPQYNYSDIATLGEVVDLSNSQEIYGVKNFFERPQHDYVDIPTVNEVVNLTTAQNIDGEKDFVIRPTVNGTGVALQGEIPTINGVVSISGNQAISGIKIFTPDSTVQIQNVVFNTLSGENPLVVQYNQPNNTPTGSQVIDYIDDGIALTRGYIGYPYNIYGDSLDNYYQFFGNPSGTLWNNEGWANLTGIENREYRPINELASPDGSDITPYDWIMKDTRNNKYHKIRFTNWQYYGESYPTWKWAGYTYTRQQISSNYRQNMLLSGGSPLLISGQIQLTESPLVSGVPLLRSGDSRLVYTTGNQTITGVKNFQVRPTVNNTGVVLFGEGTPVPIQVFGNSVSQGNASSLNFAGGGISVNTVGGQATITVTSSTQVQIAPETPSSPGVSGAFVFSAPYLYYCQRNNDWIRVALGKW